MRHLKTLSRNIRTLRHEKGWSQQEIAVRLDISIPAFSKIETGVTDVNLSRIEQIAAVFGISVIDLLMLDDPLRQNNMEDLKILNKKLLGKEMDLADLQRKVIGLYEELRDVKSPN
jgi:transcriptional regulator with XRE-family HTH domain